MTYSIVPIVEGQGEVFAVPELIRRVLFEQLCVYQFRVAKPKRLKRNRIDADLPKTLQFAAQEPDAGAIIVFVDSDEDCARALSEHISQIARDRNIGLPVATVCPTTEYEAWFMASIDSIRGQEIGVRGAKIHEAAACPEYFETISGPKEWLSGLMPYNMRYKPTQDQAILTRMIDFELAGARSRSFRRLCHAVKEVVDGVISGSASVTP